MRCPCRKKSETVTYAECCGRFHNGSATAPTAEALMRSRYAAFAQLNAAYLKTTWHPSTCPADITFNPGQQWQLLRIVAASSDGDTATVEFVARSRIAGRSQVLSELSRFVCENGRWFYVDGDVR